MRYRDLMETLLYRGDASQIDKFVGQTTGLFGLFGTGIYLTDSPVVAKDYTLKGTSDDVFKHEGATTPRDLIAAYLVASIEDEFAAEVTKRREHWQDVLNNDKERRALIDQANKREVSWDDARPQIAKIEQGIVQQHEAEIATLRKDMLRKARTDFQKRSDDFRIVTDTTGELSLVKKDRDGYLTTFDVPAEYIAKTLHGDQPLPEKVLTTIRDLFLAGRPPTQKLDMRDAHGNFLTFDAWVKAYKTTGVDYAWREGSERTISGRGKNPPLDVVWNGTHYGFQWFYGNLPKFVEAMRGLGYVGIEYHGGTRIGGHVRGGGGIKHRAYVFWDDDEINAFKTGSEKVVDDPKIDPAHIKGIRASSRRRR